MHRDGEDLKASMQLVDSPTWSNRLGSKEEIAAAQQINQNSLHQAAAAFSAAEISEAAKRGELSPELAQELTALQRQATLEARRENQTTHHSKSSHKR